MSTGCLLGETLASNPKRPTASSVVRVDPKTGRLVRVVDLAGLHRAPAAQPANVQAIVEQTSRTFEVDPLLVQSVIQTESAFNPGAASIKGAQGLMQLMPATAQRFGVNDAFDPRENIEGGVKYLKYLQNLFQDDRLAIAAYNAGEGSVAKYKGIPPYKETVAYVDKVSKKYSVAKNSLTGSRPSASTPSSSAEDNHPRVIAYTDSQGRLHMTTQ